MDDMDVVLNVTICMMQKQAHYGHEGGDEAYVVGGGGQVVSVILKGGISTGEQVVHEGGQVVQDRQLEGGCAEDFITDKGIFSLLL